MKTQIHSLWFVLTSLFASLSSPVMAAAPSIDYEPKDQAVILYQQAGFGVTASGTAPLAYQWRFHGTIKSYNAGKTITINAADYADCRWLHQRVPHKP